MFSNSKLFLGLIFFLLAAGAGLLIFGVDAVNKADFERYRESQLNERAEEGREPVLVETESGISVSDYFEKSGERYRYRGGLFFTGFLSGEFYGKEDLAQELKSAETPADRFEEYLVLPTGKNSYYVNIDQGKADPVRGYLKPLDETSAVQIDTLFVDFRFMREVEFSQMIALFNQLAPPRKMNLGTIITPYQSTEIKSGGKPFFDVGLYVFILNEEVPLSVKKLAEPFRYTAGYEIWGNSDELPDTIPLFTEYTIGEKKYRIETEHFTGPEIRKKSPLPTLDPGGELKQMFRRMEISWYQSRDTAFLRNHLENWLKRGGRNPLQH